MKKSTEAGSYTSSYRFVFICWLLGAALITYGIGIRTSAWRNTFQPPPLVKSLLHGAIDPSLKSTPLRRNGVAPQTLVIVTDCSGCSLEAQTVLLKVLATTGVAVGVPEGEADTVMSVIKAIRYQGVLIKLSDAEIRALNPATSPRVYCFDSEWRLTYVQPIELGWEVGLDQSKDTR